MGQPSVDSEKWILAGGLGNSECHWAGGDLSVVFLWGPSGLGFKRQSQTPKCTPQTPKVQKVRRLENPSFGLVCRIGNLASTRLGDAPYFFLYLSLSSAPTPHPLPAAEEAVSSTCTVVPYPLHQDLGRNPDYFPCLLTHPPACFMFPLSLSSLSFRQNLLWKVYGRMWKLKLHFLSRSPERCALPWVSIEEGPWESNSMKLSEPLGSPPSCICMDLTLKSIWRLWELIHSVDNHPGFRPAKGWPICRTDLKRKGFVNWTDNELQRVSHNSRPWC